MLAANTVSAAEAQYSSRCVGRVVCVSRTDQHYPKIKPFFTSCLSPETGLEVFSHGVGAQFPGATRARLTFIDVSIWVHSITKEHEVDKTIVSPIG